MQLRGFGDVLGFDKSKIIPNESLSLYSNCIVPWRTEKMKVWLKPLIENNKSIGVDIHKPYFDLSEREKKIVWEGADSCKGINSFLSYLERKSYNKIGVISRAWTNAQIFTPTIFSA